MWSRIYPPLPDSLPSAPAPPPEFDSSREPEPLDMVRPQPADSLVRCADALERIADVLTFLITQPADVPTCTHPDAEREVAPGSTMNNLEYRCKACGQSCPEPGA